MEAPDDVVSEILTIESWGMAQTPGEVGGT